MFAKIFSQIFDSSIAEDYLVRLVFMDFLILSDRHGAVDITSEAIARRTNVPHEMVLRAIDRLSQPDSKSRSDAAEGCRIVLLDSHRDWGWQIVNYEHYRSIVDEESRRSYFRDKQREHRAVVSKPVKDVFDSQTLSKEITHAEAEAEADGEGRKSKALSADGCSEHAPSNAQTCCEHDLAMPSTQPNPTQPKTQPKTFCSEPGKNSGSKLESGGAVRFRLPLNDGSCFEVGDSAIEKYRALYPAVDVDQQVRAMIGWLDANPTRRKTPRGIAKFVNAWLAREQDCPSGGSNGTGRTKKSGLERVFQEYDAAHGELAGE